MENEIIKKKVNFKLINRIIELSESDNWEEAIKEWRHISTDFIDEGEDPEQCLCGHYPIVECCLIENTLNLNTAIVGNCCIKLITGENNLIFNSVKRVFKNNSKSFNIDTLDYSLKKKFISEKEYKFYFNVMRKRKLSKFNEDRKKKINKIILFCFGKKDKKYLYKIKILTKKPKLYLHESDTDSTINYVREKVTKIYPEYSKYKILIKKY